MIVSASRRTDIPALYMDWMAGRIREGFVLAQNPMNARQVRRVELDPGKTEFVFWTKNAEPMLRYLPLLEPFPYYVQFTVTPYGPDIEPGLPSRQKRLDAFRRLSDHLGPQRVIWRCDPLLWGTHISTAWLAEEIDRLADSLAGWTHRCIISFVDIYRCMRKRFTAAGLRPGQETEKLELAARLRDLAAVRNMEISACCEAETAGLLPQAHCVDAALLRNLSGRDIPGTRDRNQRPLCGCSVSTDIGVYNSCRHGCIYCYAMRSAQAPAGQKAPGNSPLLPAGTHRSRRKLWNIS